MSLVCGSASYRKLPLLLARLEAGERRVSRPRHRHRRNLRDRTDAARPSLPRLSHDHRGLRQGLLVLRGAVHARAGAQPRQRFHPAGSARTGRRRLHRDPTARANRQLLPRSLASASELCRAAGGRGGSSGNPPRALHDLASARPGRDIVARHGRGAGDLRSRASAGAVGFDARSARHAAHLHARGVSRKDRPDSRGARRPISITTDIIVGFPGETERGLRGDAEPCSTLAQFDGVFSFQYSPRPTRRRAPWPMPCPERKRAGGCRCCRSASGPFRCSATRRLVGQAFEVLVEGASRRETQWAGRTSSNRVLNFTSPRSDLLGEYVRVRVTGAGPNSLAGEHVHRIGAEGGSDGS